MGDGGRLLDRADPAHHVGCLLGKFGVLAEHVLPGAHLEQVRAEPVELGQQVGAARVGDPDDRHQCRDPDRDPECRQHRTARSRAHAREAEPRHVTEPQRHRARLLSRLSSVSMSGLDRVLDTPVADVDDPRHRGGHLTIVGDHDDRRALGVEHPEDVEDLGTGHGVEVAGGLVGEDHRRLGDDRSGDRHPLPLAARQLGRPVVEPVAEADPLEGGDRSAPSAACRVDW